jgi:hypothetical protein
MFELTARDEREAAVDRAADRLAYLVLSFGLLLLAAYRSFVDRVDSFDLLLLVIAGGGVGLVYRLSRRAVTGRSVAVIAATMLLALLVAGAIAVVRG